MTMMSRRLINTAESDTSARGLSEARFKDLVAEETFNQQNTNHTRRQWNNHSPLPPILLNESLENWSVPGTKTQDGHVAPTRRQLVRGRHRNHPGTVVPASRWAGPHSASARLGKCTLGPCPVRMYVQHRERQGKDPSVPAR